MKTTINPGEAQNQISNHVFLRGRPPISEYLGFVKGMAVNGSFLDQGQLINEWREANDKLKILEEQENGLANNPLQKPIPEKFNSLTNDVIANPIFQASFNIVPSNIAMVNLKQLVVYQKFINLSFVDTIIQELGSNPTEEDIFKFALGLNRLDPPVKFLRTQQNTFTFISPSNDFRFLEVAPLTLAQIPDNSHSGYPSAAFALIVGYGSNCLNVINFENRFILNNGSHRAYALYKLGVEYVPCVIQNVSLKEELELVGPVLLQNHDFYFKNSRPPMLKDYFDGQLIKVVPVQSKNRMVRLQFGVETVDIPAT